MYPFVQLPARGFQSQHTRKWEVPGSPLNLTAVQNSLKGQFPNRTNNGTTKRCSSSKHDVCAFVDAFLKFPNKKMPKIPKPSKSS